MGREGLSSPQTESVIVQNVFDCAIFVSRYSAQLVMELRQWTEMDKVVSSSG